MKKLEAKHIILGIILMLLLVIIIALVKAFIKQAAIDYKINDDYTSLLNDTNYQIPVTVEGISNITQEISCGYAVIEMLAIWQSKDITELSLYEDNNEKITTSLGIGFVDELSKQFPEWNVTQYTNLTNTELLQLIYESLANGMPVPIEFAALYNNETWTLHFAIVTGMDLLNDIITVQNPYGYEEHYTVDDFLKATRYESYENMEFYFKLGFAFGIFHKNTIYIITT